MNVTRSNYKEVLEEMDEVLSKATFLAIDGEFTGLVSGPETKPFDTPSQYYDKVKSGSMEFLLVQLGLSVFTYDTDVHKYNQRSYNFYVFPKPLNKNAPDCRFMCQASCISFLANQGFDFNKLFLDGIPYLNTYDEDKLVKKFEEKQKLKDESVDIPISNEQKPHIDEICEKIDNFLKSDEEELIINGCNSYIRRIVYQEVRQRWPNKVRVETKGEGSMLWMSIFKMGTKDEEEKREAEKKEKEKLEIQEAIGLTTLLRKISDSGKLIVGHNMILDLCHIIQQFFGPLPNKYLEFKSLIHSLFPKLIDTKVMAQSAQLKEKFPSTILNHVWETINKPPFTLPETIPIEGRGYSSLTESYHEAGFDAFITGLCFIGMCDYIGSLESPKVSPVLPDSSLIKSTLNKLSLGRLKDYDYMNLVGDDPKPSRNHVYHATFPKEWRTCNLTQLFFPYGGAFVSWLTDTTAYISLHRKEQALTLNKKLKKRKNILGSAKIQPYVEYQAHLEETQLSNSPEEDRKRKRSPQTEDNSEASKYCEQGDNQNDNNDDDSWEVVSGKRKKKRHQTKEEAPTKKVFTEQSWE